MPSDMHAKTDNQFADISFREADSVQIVSGLIKVHPCLCLASAAIQWTFPHANE